MRDFNVSINVDQADKLIDEFILEGSFTGTLVGTHEFPCGMYKGIVSVYEKHYYRAGNRLTVTCILYPLNGYTHVHLISGGGGEGFFRFDWGASDDFEAGIESALREYIV